MSMFVTQSSFAFFLFLPTQASKLLKQLPFKVDSIEQLYHRGIGPKTLEKIEQLLRTGQCKRLDCFKSDPKLVALSTLSKVWGIGSQTARLLVENSGIYTVNELKERILEDQALGRIPIVNDIVTKTVMIHDDLMAKIPRHEVEAIRDSIIPVAGEMCIHFFYLGSCVGSLFILVLDFIYLPLSLFFITICDQTVSILPGVEVQVVGSYRRGNLTSGDVVSVIYALFK